MPRPWVAVALAAVGWAARVPAAPLDLVPPAATLVVAVDRPGALVEAARTLPAYRSSLDAIPAVREALDSTPARRFFQFVTFAEKELGAPWPTLLDRAAGGGLVLAVRTGPDPAPALLAVRGTDEQTVADAYKLLVRSVAEEEARQPGAKGPRAADYKGTPTAHVGDDFHAARVGPAILVSNTEAALHAGLDQARDPMPTPGPAAARKLVGGDPLAWLWFDLETAKKTKAAQDFYENSRKDLNLTLVAGGTIDALRRADLLAAGLHRTADGLTATLRLPAKRAGLAPELAFHLPAGDAPGSLPLLEPPGVVYSQSFCLDLGRMWADRAKVINGQQIKDIEKGFKEVSRFLPGTSLEKLFEQSGAYHRVVMVADEPNPYPAKPVQPIPPFAVVSSFRDPAFAKGATTALRAAGLATSFQLKWVMDEETHDGVTIVSYRYPDKVGYQDGDAENYRFNFLPCFAVVDSSLVMASRPGLLKALIPELRKDRQPGAWSPAVWRARAYAPGAAELVRANPDPLVANAVLAEGVGLDAARRQVDAVAKWAAGLGAVDLTLDHKADVFEAKLAWTTRRNVE
jgi:hypothetical protein